MSSIKMYNNLVLITCCVIGTTLAYPVSQPLYQSQPQPQQVQQFQQIPAEYLQQYLLQAQQRALQPQATPVKDPEQNEPQLDQGIARQPPQQVLPNNVDRQVCLKSFLGEGFHKFEVRNLNLTAIELLLIFFIVSLFAVPDNQILKLLHCLCNISII